MKPRTVVVIGSFSVVLYIVAVIFVYKNHLGNVAFLPATHEQWGQFGDYFGGLLNPIFALLNVILVAYIAFSVQKLGEEKLKSEQESERRIQSVIDMHREWNSGSIYSSRNIAGKLLRDYPSATIFEIEKEVPNDKASHIWVVIGFFQRLAFLVEHDKLHKKMVIELFAELFVWWWIVSFEKQLSLCECDARDRIFILKNWIYENTTEQQRSPWIQRAKKDLTEAVEIESLPPFFVI